MRFLELRVLSFFNFVLLSYVRNKDVLIVIISIIVIAMVLIILTMKTLKNFLTMHRYYRSTWQRLRKYSELGARYAK